MHIAERINKAYSMLWLIKRNFTEIGREAFLLLYKHLVRSHLEYCNFVWATYKKCYIDKLEKVQKRCKKMIPKLRKMHYPDRLKQLNLPTLTYRRSRGDMIKTYKLLIGKYDLPVALPKNMTGKYFTRGNLTSYS